MNGASVTVRGSGPLTVEAARTVAEDDCVGMLDGSAAGCDEDDENEEEAAERRLRKRSDIDDRGDDSGDDSDDVDI
jgi:hypothetical protein